MRPRTMLVALAVLGGAALCVRLGIWQLARLEEKRALNRVARERFAAPPVPVEDLASSKAEGRRVEARGRYDAGVHVLLSARFHRGEPGVEVVTPLKLERGGAMLVNRGWLPAEDAIHARPQDHPEPGLVTVVAVAESIGRGVRGSTLRTLESDSVLLLSTSALDRDSLAARLDAPFAPFVLHQLPGPGVPPLPARIAPEPLDESIHLGYAVQWFAVAAILLGGSAWLAWTRRRIAARPRDSLC